MGTVEEILIEHAWKDIEICFEAKRDLDNKTNMILVANGVLAGLIINGLQSINIILCSFAMVCIVISSFFCVKAISLRSYLISNSMDVWRELLSRNLLERGSEEEIEAKKNIFATINEATEHNWNVYEEITANFRRANITFFIALLIIGVGIIAVAVSVSWVPLQLLLQNATIIR